MEIVNWEKIINEKEILENIYTGEYNQKNIILFKGKTFKEIDNIDNIQIKSVLLSEKTLNSTLIIFKNWKMLNVFENLLFLAKNYEKFFDNIIELFRLANPLKEYKILSKLRGDFGEALFIKYFGGKKIQNEQKYDILLNDEYYEVKTFSLSKNTIMIKNSQIRDSVKIIAFNLVLDNDGETIMDLATAISDKDPDFASKIKEKYSKNLKWRFKEDGIWEVYPEKIENYPDAIIDSTNIYSFRYIKKKSIQRLKKI